MDKQININNENYEVEYLGRDSFAKVYAIHKKNDVYADKKEVLLYAPNCRFREMLANQKENIPFLPELTKLNENYYIMPYYTVDNFSKIK